MIKNKDILFISPVFHGYEKLISDKLKGLGAQVTFLPEREYSLKYKILNTINPSYIDLLQIKYYEKNLKFIEDKKFDFLFVIRGYKLPEFFLRKFKQKNPNAQLIMYQWDSNRTNPFSHLINLFDRVLSFDYKDCEELHLRYLPLFYTDDIIPYISKNNKNSKYDFFFMGTYLPNRYNALSIFMNKYKAEYDVLAYIYIPFTSLVKEILKGNIKTLKYLSIHHMKREKYLYLLSKSKAIIDVSNSRQTGLAMRIIEALALGKKVVTNNNNIYKEPFFCAENILVYDDLNPDVSRSFLNAESINNREVLSIEKWLKSIFKKDE